MFNTLQLLYDSSGWLNHSPFEIDISKEIKNLIEKPAPENGELITTVLHKSQELNIALVKMHEGAEIRSFQGMESVTFSVLLGKIQLNIRKGSLTLNEGESLILYEKTMYRIASTALTVLLLTQTY